MTSSLIITTRSIVPKVCCFFRTMFCRLASAVVLLCVLSLLSTAHASCPEIEAYMDTCIYNRTALLSELYYTLALPGDPTHCVSASRLAVAYERLVPLLFKKSYGSQFDDHVFNQCDWISDGRYCAVDVQQTKCTCATVCEMLVVVNVMIESSKAYPDWESVTVPWNL